MLFETDDIYVDLTQPADIGALVGVYNSQTAFVRHHLHRTSVAQDWMAEEIRTTRDAGFWSCKVVEKSTRRVRGFLDFHIATETYLSLLMVHRSHAHRGLGQQVYGAFEAFASSHQSRSICIDVVTGYDDRVLKFWARTDFGPLRTSR